ncbi:MAG: TrkH family potassium uptake protein, partial [Spirochaetaceae bacterium]|nr:TrkH family potassium uptake protein [Spirochaetaceae bacterium]MCF7951122.1 TrkH family potassium uptake protein [Spirochaetaceae bacterium]
MKKEIFNANTLYVLAALLLSIGSLIIEFALAGTVYAQIAWYIDFLIMALLLAEIISDARRASSLQEYLRLNIPALLFFAGFLLLFLYSKITYVLIEQKQVEDISRGIIIVRNTFILLKVFSRLRRLSSFFESIATQPAQTILFSFQMVILGGTLLLMLPFTTTGGNGLPFIDALFTSTSAVCVTGLIVVDTATAFTLWGQLVILVLIQVGGLGIMIISYFTLFSIRQKVSVQDKLLLSYMLSEQNMSALSKRVKIIIYSTFAIEAIGALLLAAGFHTPATDWHTTLLHSVFHAVSAFCNAGFALFSDSLEGFADQPLITLTVAGLIMLGGISFAVLTDFYSILGSRLKASFNPTNKIKVKRQVSLNTYVVVVATPVLLVSGMLLFYGLEHSNTLAELPLGRQYLAAFFQSVTLRTAGFNTIPIGALHRVTLLSLIPFMFIGAATMSTAGGIKINNVAVMYAYLKSLVRGHDSVLLRGYSLSRSQVNKAFLV